MFLDTLDVKLYPPSCYRQNLLKKIIFSDVCHFFDCWLSLKPGYHFALSHLWEVKWFYLETCWLTSAVYDWEILDLVTQKQTKVFGVHKINADKLLVLKQTWWYRDVQMLCLSTVCGGVCKDMLQTSFIQLSSYLIISI